MLCARRNSPLTWLIWTSLIGSSLCHASPACLCRSLSTAACSMGRRAVQLGFPGAPRSSFAPTRGLSQSRTPQRAWCLLPRHTARGGAGLHAVPPRGRPRLGRRANGRPVACTRSRRLGATDATGRRPGSRRWQASPMIPFESPVRAIALPPRSTPLCPAEYTSAGSPVMVAASRMSAAWCI